MDNLVKILHIDPDFNVTYFIIRTGVFIHSPISLQEAVSFLKTEAFDLILSEPHNKAILTPQHFSKQMDLNSYGSEFLMNT